ncbi:squalene synthase HpnC [Sulfuritalea sp.]|uniref:squalene synthase HpnC n=1 Tax=Sulfuritalea sp. TaxID=2480090 RepID=UPI001ACB34F3|nr:squalene synthase HpnC [Sulfuritalea sp.]MBN8474501.1 squalene synthase HpnC [Sulfuritalea sp.]
MAVDHYENFPVASILLPASLREPVAAIYGFARSADDFADEGDLAPERRRELLAGYQAELDAMASVTPTRHPIFLRLRPVVARYELPAQLFRDLLDAFQQDVVKDRYQDFAELMDYCRRSADPVGRLLLHLFGHATAENLRRSDAICSALQLINHWQDVGIDAGKGSAGRIYLPRDDMARFGVDDAAILRRVASADFRHLLRFQVDRARALMLSGASLGWDLPGRIGLEIRAIVAGGLRILDKIEAVDYDVFTRRPVLQAADWPRILWRSLVRPLEARS